ncbi:MBL fold metallo-hydrolase RNA specificity domain-containing protein [Fulvivirga sedimenti]|uniref:MBL fold metallo-hydrolase n=1 Tax=Fulvivirga sedimenti TaxID=2879465 RepID=A0A9X1HXU4_9BACT|nr:MBL fold metallo-hydrolase RNA specificity domain-containing protein [Fulvivirga sedimenti]MCA6078434.1 MBL fold metallo-hydrolase [Fulvivirga sedimenti]
MAFLEFFGATKQVTGSQHILESTDGCRIMIDCGLDLQKPEDHFPFGAKPGSIDIVILTHAHIDHSGLIPLLVKEGFDGPIYATYATYQLTRILLFDAARIMQKKYRKGRKPSFFYKPSDVEEALEQFITVDFDVKIDPAPDVSFTFLRAGHLLGAAMVSVYLADPGIRILFSGDLGRAGYPLLNAPDKPPQADYLICESTYGGRWHSDTGDIEKQFVEIIHNACVKIPGRLIVPSFSIGRTQLFLYVLNKLRVSGNLPDIRIFTDSPLAHRSTRVHEDFYFEFNQEAIDFVDEHGSLFDFDRITYLPRLNSAEEISNYNEPCIILTSSGMVRGGKSMDHVRMNLANPYCTILFIGYCAEGTLGRELLDGKKEIMSSDGVLPVMATIIGTDALSGHADQDELMNFVLHQNEKLLKRVFLVHGEPDSMSAFSTYLEKEGYQITIPVQGQRFDLLAKN